MRPPARFATACALVVAVVASACSGRRAQDPGRSGEAAVPGGAVAWVGDEAIGRDEVRAHARRTGLSPRAALTDLEDRLLLAAEARRRGYQPVLGPAARERAMVAALLASIERTVDARSVSPKAIADAASAARTAHEVKARRVYRQVVFVLPRNASMDTVSRATALAEEALRRALERGLEPEQGEASVEALRGRAEGFEVAYEARVEREFDTRRVRTAYETALLALEPGVADRVLVSSRGLHVLEVLARADALEATLADVEMEAVDAAVLRAREPVVAARIAEARRRTRIVVDEPLVARRLALVQVDAR